MMLVNCSNCRTPLQIPPGAPAIRCAICQAVTSIYQPRDSGNYGAPQPTPPNNFTPQNQIQYTPTPPHPGGSKKAVIVGIQYKYSNYELKGCLNDAKCMKYFLQNRFHFPEASIIMLTGMQLTSWFSCHLDVWILSVWIFTLNVFVIRVLLMGVITIEQNLVLITYF